MGIIDWIFIALFLSVLTSIGFFFSKKNRNVDDYFAAGRSMPGWLVALAATGTSISAGTFVGSPELGFNTNLTFIMSCVGAVIGGICRLYPRFSRNFLRLCFADVVRNETLCNVSVKIAFYEAPRAFLAVSVNAVFSIPCVDLVAVFLGLCFPVDFTENCVH